MRTFSGKSFLFLRIGKTKRALINLINRYFCLQINCKFKVNWLPTCFISFCGGASTTIALVIQLDVVT